MAYVGWLGNVLKLGQPFTHQPDQTQGPAGLGVAQGQMHA